MDEAMLFWGLGLLAASLLLIIVELFVPSGGLIAITAGVVAISGVVCLFRVSPTWGIIGIFAILLGGPSAFAFGLKIWPHTAIGRRMLGARSPEEEEAERLAEIRERERMAALVGRVGVVLSDLRPVGVVEVDGQRYDALSETSLIRAGTRIRVSIVEPTQVRVRPA